MYAKLPRFWLVGYRLFTQFTMTIVYYSRINDSKYFCFRSWSGQDYWLPFSIKRCFSVMIRKSNESYSNSVCKWQSLQMKIYSNRMHDNCHRTCNNAGQTQNGKSFNYVIHFSCIVHLNYNMTRTANQTIWENLIEN